MNQIHWGKKDKNLEVVKLRKTARDTKLLSIEGERRGRSGQKESGGGRPGHTRQCRLKACEKKEQLGQTIKGGLGVEAQS